MSLCVWKCLSVSVSGQQDVFSPYHFWWKKEIHLILPSIQTLFGGGDPSHGTIVPRNHCPTEPLCSTGGRSRPCWEKDAMTRSVVNTSYFAFPGAHLHWVHWDCAALPNVVPVQDEVNCHISYNASSHHCVALMCTEKRKACNSFLVQLNQLHSSQ